MSVKLWPRLAACAFGLVLAMSAAPAALAKQDAETVWANGQEWTMIAPHALTDPNPDLLAKAPPMYVLAFPRDPSSGQWILPPGYAPQCDPCLGVPVPPFHDHLLTGAPGFGTSGTAGEYKAPWRIVLMFYSPAFISGGHFAPVTDDEDLPAAIASGEFLPAFGPGVYERPLPVVLICPLVSPDAAG